MKALAKQVHQEETHLQRDDGHDALLPNPEHVCQAFYIHTALRDQITSETDPTQPFAPPRGGGGKKGGGVSVTQTILRLIRPDILSRTHFP